MPRQRYRVLHRMNFESPYVDMPMRLTVRQNLIGLRAALRRAGHRSNASRGLPPSSTSPNFSTGRPASCRPDRRRACRSPRRCSTSRKSLLLDEPTGFARSRHAPTGCARGSSAIAPSAGATLLLASHNMGEVERLCERVIIMKKGRIEDDDTPAHLLARYGRETLEEVFLDVARGRRQSEAAQ